MRSLSNLIKSGFVAFSKDNKLVIDANQNKIIQDIDFSAEKQVAATQEIMEEALAEAMIRDAELDGVDFGDDVLTLDTAELPNIMAEDSDLNQVTSEVYNSAKQEAEAIINSAHDEAEKLRAKAYDEAETIKKQAHDEGYEAGYQESVEAARKEIELEKQKIEQQRIQMQETFDAYIENLIKETEQQMVEILCKLIPSITGVAVEGQRGVLLYMINKSMQNLDDSKHFVIKVSSSDYKKLELQKTDIYGALNPNIDIELFEDSKLEPLQCQIETDNGIVDLSLDVQLHNLITALKLMIKD